VEKAEVAKLFKKIARNYSNFDASIENLEEYYECLEDFSFEAALVNFHEYRLTNPDFPPRPGHLRARLGEQKESQKSKDSAQEHFDKLAGWKSKAAPPPPGNREKIYELLR